jgi:hypothetical protein
MSGSSEQSHLTRSAEPHLREEDRTLRAVLVGMLREAEPLTAHTEKTIPGASPQEWGLKRL